MTEYVGVPYQPSSDTSKAAAESMVRPAGTIRQRVYRAIIHAGAAGATMDDLARRLDLGPQTLSARLNELRNEGLIRDSRQRRVGASGRRQVVYVHNRLPETDHD